MKKFYIWSIDNVYHLF